MNKTPSDLLDLVELTTGRMLFALGRMRPRVDDERESDLRPAIDKAVTHLHETLRLERRWGIVRNGANTRGEAVALDIRIDRTYSAMLSIIQGQSEGKDSDPVVQAARKLAKEVFPRGVGEVTSLAFEQQLGTTDSILADLGSEELAPLVEAVGVKRHVQTLAELNEQFRVELGKTSGITFDVVSAARTRARDLYAAVIFKVLGRYSDNDDPAAVARREELLEEVYRQDALMRDLHRRKRGPVDVDPNTGVEIDVPAADSDPAQPVVEDDAA